MLGLACSSNPAWAENAVDALDRVLVDHAHCEMKAASNAIALSARCLDHPQIVNALAEVAEEELRHFRRVLEEITRRGLRLTPPSEDLYAVELLKRANQSGRDKSVRGAIADRFLVGSLIEARSCERFKLLAAALRERAEGQAPEQKTESLALASFYEELLAAEARHYRTFVELAEIVVGDAARVEKRLTALAHIEAEIVEALPRGPTIHG